LGGKNTHLERKGKPSLIDELITSKKREERTPATKKNRPVVGIGAATKQKLRREVHNKKSHLLVEGLTKGKREIRTGQQYTFGRLKRPSTKYAYRQERGQEETFRRKKKKQTLIPFVERGLDQDPKREPSLNLRKNPTTILSKSPTLAKEKRERMHDQAL